MDPVLSLVDRFGARLVIAVSILIIVLISLSVVQTVLFFVDDINQSTAPAATSQTRAVAGSTEKTASVDIASLDLFGSDEQADTAPEVVDAPETRLNLELQGVFNASDKDESSAIVAEGNKDGELYHVGDRLPGNATLSAVFDDHILLKRGTRFEKLKFSDAAMRAPEAGARATAPPRRSTSNRKVTSPTAARERMNEIRLRNQERARGRNPNAGNPGASTQSPGGQRRSLRNYFDEYKDQISSDPSSVLSQLGVSEVTEGQSQGGYRLGSEVNNPVLMRAGFQQGDVVMSVNGRAASTAVNDATFIDQVISSARVRVEVQRGARRFFITVPIPKS